MRIVHSAAPVREPAAARPAPTAPVAHDFSSARQKMLRRMIIVAKTRFAANKRLEAKDGATNIGLQMANFYTIAIGILLIQFPGSEVLKPANGVLNYVSLIASVFVQILALIESYKDYSGKARSMHECATRINDLRQRLELDPRQDWAVLNWYQEQYTLAIKDYAVNHDAVDLQEARQDTDGGGGRGAVPMLDRLAWQVRWFSNVYGLMIAVLVSPWVVGAALLALGLR